jgi:hypothetical protein
MIKDRWELIVGKNKDGTVFDDYIFCTHLGMEDDGYFCTNRQKCILAFQK